MSLHRDLSSPVPWRRSLRAAQARRQAQARRRRLSVRGRTSSLLAVALCGFAATGALAQPASAPSAGASTARPEGVRALQQALGVTVDGHFGPKTRAAVRRFQRRHGLVVDGVVGPQTRRALGLTTGRGAAANGTKETSADTGAASAGGEAGTAAAREATAAKAWPAIPAATRATLESIAACESGGRPTAVSANGLYRGKYQFHRSTWRALGGTGDPAAAPEAEQDHRAATLLARSGTSPWPSCA